MACVGERPQGARRRGVGGVIAPLLSDASASYTPSISERRGAATTFLHSGIKNADAQTSTAGSVSGTRVYDAFGAELSSTGSWQGAFGYAGGFGYQEDANGFKLLGHRYYDPSTGRFLTRDPIKDGRNWYAYCRNNSITGVDPNGLDTLVFTGTHLKHFNDEGELVKMYPAFSGKPGSSKADERIQDVGPIPQGRYFIRPSEAGENFEDDFGGAVRAGADGSGRDYCAPVTSWGQARVPIHPTDGTNTFNRGGFFLHGGDEIGSAGCIDIGHRDRELILDFIRAHEGDIKVIVDYSNWNSRVPSGKW